MNKIKRFSGLFLLVSVVAFLSVVFADFATNAFALEVYKEGDKFVEVNGLIQVQYHYTDPDGSPASDKIFLRRLNPGIEASLFKDWKGELELNIGEANGDNEVEVEEAVVEYSGFNNVELAFGNDYFVFSRELRTPYTKQQLVERTFVGNHHYGTPEEVLGFFVNGSVSGERITYRASVAAADIEPDSSQVAFESPVNPDDAFNQGWIVGGRVDFHPFGFLPFAQGDFNRRMKTSVGVAVFRWFNDNDNNPNTTSGSDISSGATPDVDTINGVEVDAALRFRGISIDTEYNFFDVQLQDSSVTGGLFRNGSTDLENFSIEGGYMVIPKRLEVVGGFQWQDADNYNDAWTRYSVGVNYFFKEHDIKVQATYRIGQDIDGTSGNDQDEFFAQTQFVF